MAKSSRSSGGGKEKGNESITMDLDELLVVLGENDTSPKGVRVSVLAEQWNVGERTARRYLKKAVKMGICKQVNTWYRDKNGRRNRGPAYVFTEKAMK